MLSFSHAVRTCDLLDEKEKRDFERIQVACSAMTAMTGASSRNLEDIASLLSVLKLSQPGFRFAECSHYKTPEQALDLVDICIRSVFAPANHGYSQRSELLLSHVASQSNLSIVTTNYDMHVELGAAHLGATVRTAPWVSKCLETGKTSHNLCSIYKSTYIPNSESTKWSFELFKLHGSVNWFAGTVPSVEDRWFVEARRQDDWPEKYRLGISGLADQLSSKRLLVPPAVVKAEGFGQLAEEWQGASAALSRADAVWFIGYGFPQSDAFMRYFLAGALQANTRVRQVAIIDPCALDIAERTQDLFGSAELADLVEPMPFKWEEFAHQMPQLLNRKWTLTGFDLTRLRQQLEAKALLRNQVLPYEEPPKTGLRGRGRGRGRASW